MSDWNPFRGRAPSAAAGGAAETAAPAPEAPAPAPAAPGGASAPRAAGRPPPSQLQQGAKVGMDCCWGVRKTYTAIVRGLGTTKVITGLAAGLPMIVAAILLAAAVSPSSVVGYEVGFAVVAASIKPVIGTIAGVTFAAGLLAILAVWQGLQNLLALCAWVYTVIGHFSLVSVFIVLFTGFSVWTAAVVGTLLAYTALPVLAWLFSSSIMSAHVALITERIDAAHGGGRGLQAQADDGGVDVEAVGGPPPPAAAAAAGAPPRGRNK
jgi:hypothetical protein